MSSALEDLDPLFQRVRPDQMMAVLRIKLKERNRAFVEVEEDPPF